MATPLTQDRNTEKKEMGPVQTYKVAAATTIFKGALCAVNATGFLVPATNAAGQIVVGLSEHSADNSAGADGDLSCNCMKGRVALNGEGGDLPTQALIGHGVYAASDNEVEATPGAGVFAGTLVEIDGADYWIDIFDQAVT